MDYKLPFKKIIAGIIVFIMLILLCGFADTYMYSNESDWIFILKSIGCLTLMLTAIVIGKLYEEIPEKNQEEE